MRELLLARTMAFTWLMVVAWVPPSAASEDPEHFERRIRAQLKAENAEAVPVFQEANQAREREDYQKAAELYAEVHRLAPDFVHAIRRRCGSELNLGHRELAVELCREALRREESAENLSTLALALSANIGEAQAPINDRNQALALALKSVRLDPNNMHGQIALCQVALALGDQLVLMQCVRKLKEIAPDELVTHTFAVIGAIDFRLFDQAEASLERARQLGLPDGAYRSLAARISKERAATRGLSTPSRTERDIVDQALLVGAWGGMLWIGSLVILFAVGWVLSLTTLRTARRIPDRPGGQVRGLDGLLRKVYRVVLWLCCGYYYISLPIILILVVGVASTVIYGFLTIGRVPVKLVLLLCFGVVITVFAVLRSLFVRGLDQDPGFHVNLDENPTLRSVLLEVAARVGTRPVDNVYLTPGTDVAVMERGSMFRQLTGGKERCLILGVGVLSGMPISAFKAVLAHEYGHFSNRDTAGGGFALAVRRSLFTMAENLARGGAATWYNPAWLFVNGFLRVFLRISQGASRLQEVLADRWAAFAYGSLPFEDGLQHVIRQSLRFDFHAERTIQEVVEQRQPLSNLYTYTPKAPLDDTQVEQAVLAAMEAKVSPYDSHPAPRERLNWVRSLRAQGAGFHPGDRLEAWSVFYNPAKIQLRMTELIRANLASNGIAIG